MSFCNPDKIKDIHPSILKTAIDSFIYLLGGKIQDSDNILESLKNLTKENRSKIFSETLDNFGIQLKSQLRDAMTEYAKLHNLTDIKEVQFGFDSVIKGKTNNEEDSKFKIFKNHFELFKQKGAFLTEVQSALKELGINITHKEQRKEEYKQSLEDIVEDTTNREFDNFSRDGIVEDKFKIDTSELVDSNLKFFLSTIPTTENNIFNLPKLADFNFINRTLNTIGINTSNFKDIITNLDNTFRLSSGKYKEGYEWISYIKKGLGTEDQTLTEGKTKLRIAFETYLKSYNYSPQQLMLSAEGNNNVTDSVKFFNQKDAINTWKMSVISDSIMNKDGMFKLDNDSLEINRDSLAYKKFIETSPDANTEILLKNLRSLGIKLNEDEISESKNIKILLSTGKLSSINNVIRKAYNGLFHALTELDDKKEYFKTTTFNELFTEAASSRFNELASIHLELNPDQKRYMIINAEDKAQHVRQAQSTVAQQALALSKAKTPEDVLKLLPHLVGLGYFTPIRKINGESMLSPLMNILFDKNGQRKNNSSYEINLMSGIRDRKNDEGKTEASLSEDEQILYNITSILKNAYPLGMNGDKSMNFLIQLSEAFHTWDDIIKNPKKVEDSFMYLLRDEMDCAWRERERPNVTPDAPATDIFSNEVYKLGVFGNILDKSLVHEFITNVVGGKVDNQTMTKPLESWKIDTTSTIGDRDSYEKRRENFLTKNKDKIVDAILGENGYVNRTLVNDLKNSLIENRLLQNTDKGYELYGISKESINNSLNGELPFSEEDLKDKILTEKEVNNLCKYISVNYFIGRIEQDKLHFGHIAFFKDPFKRWNMFTAIKEQLASDDLVLQTLTPTGVNGKFLPNVNGRQDKIPGRNDSFVRLAVHAEHIFTQKGYDKFANELYKDLQKQEISKVDAEKQIGCKFDDNGVFQHLLLDDKGKPTGTLSKYIGTKGSDSFSYMFHDFYWNYRQRLGDISTEEDKLREYDWAYNIVGLTNYDNSHKGENYDFKFNDSLIKHAESILEKYKDSPPNAQLNSIKPQAATFDKNGIPVLLKTAPTYLTWRIVEGTANQKIYLDAIKSGLDWLVPPSAQKIGAALNKKNGFDYLTNLDGSLSLKGKDLPIRELYPDGIGKQTEITEHDEVKGSQRRKLIYSNAAKNPELKPLVDHAMSTERKLISSQVNRLMDDAGISSISSDPSKFMERLRNSLLKSGVQENQVEALNIYDKKILTPLDLTNLKSQVEHMCWSIFNDDFINPLHPGQMAVQTHNVGQEDVKWTKLNPKTGLHEDINEKEIKEQSLTQKDLQILSPENEMYRVGEDGKTIPIQVTLTWPFKKSPKELGVDQKYLKGATWHIPTEELNKIVDPELCKYHMIRIPTGGINSILHIESSRYTDEKSGKEFTKFFDKSRGNIVEVGSFIIDLTDSDFDGDKMQVFRREYTHKDGKLSKVSSDEESVEGYRNKMMDIFEQLLSHRENFSAISTPISIGEVEKQAKAIDDLKGVTSDNDTNPTKTHELITTLKARKTFLEAKGMLGPAARAFCQHVLNQICNFQLTGTFNSGRYSSLFGSGKSVLNSSLTEAGIPTLGEVNNNNGQSISTLLTNFTQGILEAAKNPAIFKLAITKENVGAFFNKVLQGADPYKMALLFNQPIIQDFLHEKRLGSSLVYKLNTGNGRAKPVMKIIDQILSKYGYGSETETPTIALKNEMSLQPDYKLTQEDLEKGISGKYKQGIMLYNYLKTELEGGYAFTFNQRNNSDTVGLKTFMELIKHLKLNEQVIEDAYIKNPQDLNKSFISDIDEGTNSIMHGFNKYMMYLHPAFKELRDFITDFVTDGSKQIPSQDRDKLVNKFIDFTLTHLIQNTPNSEGNKISKMTNLLLGEKTMGKVLQKIKNNVDENLWNNLQPLLSETESSDSMKLLKMNNNPFEIKTLLHELQVNKQLSQDPDVQFFVKNLANYHLLQTGIGSGRNSIGKILPHEQFQDAIQHVSDLYEMLKDKNGVLKQHLQEEHSSIIDEFFRNNFANKNLVPTVRLAGVGRDGSYGDYDETVSSSFISISKDKPSSKSEYVKTITTTEVNGKTEYTYSLYKKAMNDPKFGIWYQRINTYGKRGFHVETGLDGDKSINKENNPFDENADSIYEKIPQEILSRLDKNKIYFKETTESHENVVPLQDMKQEEKSTKMSEFVNHSGGAYGADTDWDLIGREFGVTQHNHYREETNANLSQRLRNRDIQAVKLTAQELEEGYKGLEQTFGKHFERNLQNNLKARNYFQVKNADAIYAVGKFKENKSGIATEVNGGTNAAVQMSIDMRKPTYVFDLTSRTWNEWDGDQFVHIDTPILTKNFAGIGTRDIENYNVQKDGKWQPREQYVGKELEQVAQNAIRNVYQKTLDSLKQQSTTGEKIIPLTEDFSRKSVKNDPEHLYLFTDNAKRTSGPNEMEEGEYTKKYGKGNYPGKTQAVIRGLNNAMPITTMIDDKRTQWIDSKFEEYKKIIDSEIEDIKTKLNSGNYRGLKFAAQMPFGKGQISDMKSTAPKIWSYLNTKLKEIGIDNTGEKPTVSKESNITPTPEKPVINNYNDAVKQSTDTSYKHLFSTQELNDMYKEHVNLKGENKMSPAKYKEQVESLLDCPWDITKEELTEAIKCL